MEEKLNLTTKVRLLTTRHWVNCSHKMNINEIKARKNPLGCLIKTEEGTRLNITFHSVNFDQKLNCQSWKRYSNGIKTRKLKHWLDWTQEKKKHLNQVGTTRFKEISRCWNDVKLALTVYENIVLNSSSVIKKQYNGHIFFILMTFLHKKVIISGFPAGGMMGKSLKICSSRSTWKTSIVLKGVPAPLLRAPTSWPNLSPFLKSLFHPFLRYFRQFLHPHRTPYCP